MVGNKRIVLVVGLGAAAVLSLIYGVLTPSKLRRDLSAKGEPVQPSSPQLVKPIVPRARALRRTAYASWGKNPFAVTESRAERSSKVVLNGIAWDERNPKVMINDQIVGVGDEIGGNKVVSIRDNGVTLNDGERDFELTLGVEGESPAAS